MRTKQANLLIAFVAVVVFSFSCFCISRMTQTSNQLIVCRNHILEFKENILRLKSETENNRQDLTNALNYMKYEITHRGNLSESFVEKIVDTLSKKKMEFNRFEELKFFLPHLKRAGRLYPNVISTKGKTGVSYAVGISTVNRGNQTYLKQTLTSVLSRMTLSEEEDSVVIVSIADSNEDYLNSVVDMIKTKFKRQVNSGSLEVISIPTFFYPSTLRDKQTTKEPQKTKSWRMKQVLDFCILMLYAQPKATYYLQLEDDIIAKRMYFTKMADFVHDVSSANWFFIEFSVLGFIGKLFKSEDLHDFVRFFLMFYKDKPIDLLLDDIFLVKECETGESLINCKQRKEERRIQYRPSLFQHVGISSSLSGKKQHLKEFHKSNGFFKNYTHSLELVYLNFLKSG